jgi:uridine phosphorylase
MIDINASYPILEFDPIREAMVEPTRVIEPGDVAEHCVICFFKEVLDKVAVEYAAQVAVDIGWSDGPHLIHEIIYQGRRLAFFFPGIGAPLAAGLFEEAIAFGCKKFIVCGGCGVLEKGIAVGHLIIVSSAIRDEGVSYHYLPPGREVSANPAGVSALINVLEKEKIPYRVGKTWTTDGPYRETAVKVAARRQEGCLTVEMEAAGLMAVAKFRGVVLGQILYGGDDLSGSNWDNRKWQDRTEIRENLFWLAAQACLSL